jgi:thioesterase domain-containing protein
MSKDVVRLCPNCQGKITRQDEGKGICPTCGAMLLSLAPRPNKMAQDARNIPGQMDDRSEPMSKQIVSQTPTNGKTQDQEITWRHIFRCDREDAEFLRSLLGFAQAYPTKEADKSNRLEVANLVAKRHELHEIIDEMDLTDMQALYKVARLLAIIPRPKGWIKWYADTHEALFRQKYPEIASQMRQ